MAGASASNVATRSAGTRRSPGRRPPGGIRAVDRALRISVTSSRTWSTAASVAGSRTAAQLAGTGQPATISSSGSSASWGVAAQIASVR